MVHGFTRCEIMLQTVTQCYMVLHSVNIVLKGFRHWYMVLHSVDMVLQVVTHIVTQWYMVLHGVDIVLHGVTWCCHVLQGATRYYRVLNGV